MASQLYTKVVTAGTDPTEKTSLVSVSYQINIGLFGETRFKCSVSSEFVVV